ncbi:MAG: hypothetical protein IAI50_15430 [Candidatus Eremiobacteraeota bacterium]|nr:hypothetical protein [Candidatus Eremiobacteraeota bacterium]
MREAGVRNATLLTLACVLLGARAASRPVQTRAVALPPGVVLQRYAAALAALPRPKSISFDYTVEQLGLRNLEQTHRVYRSGLRERDETVVVDGYVLTRPAIRIFNNRTYRYDISSIAPKAATYAFVFAGVVRTNDGYGYVYRTAARAPGSFAVSEIEIDGRTFLPSIVRFKIAGGGAHGSGALQYGRSELYWVVREVRVNARLTDGTTAHERIAWTNYQFPTGLPPSTFDAPHAVATEAPTVPLAP